MRLRKMKSLEVPIELREDGAPVRPPRRVFVERREIPGLVLGTARGDAVACRRVLGARRGGRIGFTLASAGLALSAPSLRTALLAALLHVSLGLLVGIGARVRSGHRTREVQRLAVWTVLTPLCVVMLVRLAGFGSPWHCSAAAVAGQLLLVRALRATRAG
jgi:ABC-type dipeptide/oligopeptide/nickel transport system permease subunit